MSIAQLKIELILITYRVELFIAAAAKPSYNQVESTQRQINEIQDFFVNILFFAGRNVNSFVADPAVGISQFGKFYTLDLE